MKRLFLIFAVGLGMVACNDNNSNDNGTGGSIDSNYASPNTSGSTDQTTVAPDSSMNDSNNGAIRSATGDTNMRKDNPGSSGAGSGAGSGSGQTGSGSSTNS